MVKRVWIKLYSLRHFATHVEITWHILFSTINLLNVIFCRKRNAAGERFTRRIAGKICGSSTLHPFLRLLEGRHRTFEKSKCSIHSKMSGIQKITKYVSVLMHVVTLRRDVDHLKQGAEGPPVTECHSECKTGHRSALLREVYAAASRANFDGWAHDLFARQALQEWPAHWLAPLEVEAIPA